MPLMLRIRTLVGSGSMRRLKRFLYGVVLSYVAIFCIYRVSRAVVLSRISGGRLFSPCEQGTLRISPDGCVWRCAANGRDFSLWEPMWRCYAVVPTAEAGGRQE